MEDKREEGGWNGERKEKKKTITGYILVIHQNNLEKM